MVRFEENVSYLDTNYTWFCCVSRSSSGIWLNNNFSDRSIGTSIYPPSIDDLSKRFRISTEVGLLGLSSFVLGLACGPIIGSPASEIFGRQPVYLISIPILGLFILGAGLHRILKLSSFVDFLLVCLEAQPWR
jgi:MFS family permease